MHFLAAALFFYLLTMPTANGVEERQSFIRNDSRLYRIYHMWDYNLTTMDDSMSTNVSNPKEDSNSNNKDSLNPIYHMREYNATREDDNINLNVSNPKEDSNSSSKDSFHHIYYTWRYNSTTNDSINMNVSNPKEDSNSSSKDSFHHIYHTWRYNSTTKDESTNMNVSNPKEDSNSSSKDSFHHIYYTRRYNSTTEDDSISMTVSNPKEDSNSSTENSLYAFPNDTSTTEDIYSILDEEFKTCPHLNLGPEYYEKKDNGSVYVSLFNKWFNRSHYFIRDDGLFFYCPSFYNKTSDPEKFSDTLSIVSRVCVGISSACIVLHIIMFTLVRRLRNLPGYILLSLCLALLSAYVCLIVQYFVEYDLDCMVIGMFLLYFFLASFFWMNTMSYDVWRSIRMATTKLRLTADRPIMVRFARYSLYAWGAPLIIVIASIIVHNYSTNRKYTLIFNMENCWFAYKQALTVYFVIPLLVLLGVNIVYFVSSFYMILNSSMSKSQSGGQTGVDLWSRLFLSLRLGSTMGFMWIFGIIAAFTEQEWLWYLYAVCNPLQGVFIFFSFTVSERTRKACMKVFKGNKISLVPTQASSQPSSAV